MGPSFDQSDAKAETSRENKTNAHLAPPIRNLENQAVAERAGVDRLDNSVAF